MLSNPARVLALRCFTPACSNRSSDRLRVGSCRGRGSHPMASEPESEPEPDTVSESEWQRWGTSSPLPAMVADVIGGLRSLERDFDEKMSFGGLGGKLQGTFKVQEDKKHRAVYQSLTDSEMKLQFFSARLLGSRDTFVKSVGFLWKIACVQNLFPALFGEESNFGSICIQRTFCRKITQGSCYGKSLELRLHLCLFGIYEPEEMMWDSFRKSGKSMVWFLYPNKNASPKSVQDIFNSSFTKPEGHITDLVDKAFKLCSN